MTIKINIPYSSQVPNNNNASIRNRQHLPILRGDLKNAVRSNISSVRRKLNLCVKSAMLFIV